MGPRIESLEDVLKEMVCISQHSLPPRPSSDEYTAAVNAANRADHILSAKMNEILNEKRPDSVPEHSFNALQKMKQEVIRFQINEQKKTWMAVIELEERYRRFEQLMNRARGSDSVNGPVNGLDPVNGQGTSVLNGIESSSSGELSEDFGRAKKYESSASVVPSVVLPPETVKRIPSDTASTKQLLPSRSFDSLSLASTAPRGSDASIAAPTAPKVQQSVPGQSYGTLTAALKDQQHVPDTSAAENDDPDAPYVPQKLYDLIENAFRLNSEELIITDTFVRDKILLPETIGQLTSLRVLELPGNRIVKIPESIGNLIHLTVLDLQSNQLTSLPENIGRLTKLRKLDVEKNAIEELPWTIGNCESLEELRADFNQLKALPEAVGYLGNLQILTAHLNCLKSLPTTMAYLTSLKHLDVHFNQLESIPESICFCTTLKKLDISSNFHALRYLPYKIGNLQELVELDISYNSITELPDSFVLLTNLQKLRVEGNPWRIPPLEVMQKGKEAIFEYMQEKIKKDQKEKLARKKRSFIVKAVHACYGFFGRLCQSKADDPVLNILA